MWERACSRKRQISRHGCRIAGLFASKLAPTGLNPANPLIKTIGVVMDQPSANPQRSYTRGSQDKALLAMTIGQKFDQTVAQYPDGEALVVRHQQLRYSWRQLAERSICMPERCWPWVCRLAIDSVSGRRTARSGASRQFATRENRRDPGQHQPGLPQLRTGIRAQAIRLPMAGLRRGVQDLRTTTPCCRDWCQNWPSNPSANCAASVCRTCAA